MNVPQSATAVLRSHRRVKHLRPETIRQARTWDTVKHQVMQAGICERCAAQYAWGTQTGFSDVKPPCDQCAGVVDAKGGRERPNGWRTLHKIRSKW